MSEAILKMLDKILEIAERIRDVLIELLPDTLKDMLKSIVEMGLCPISLTRRAVNSLGGLIGVSL